MNISIIGASGFIGSHLALSLAGTASVYGTYYQNEATKVPGCAYTQADLLSPQSLRRHFASAQPDVIILSAGTRDLARCEKEPEQARLVHVEGTKNILAACEPFSPYIIYLSTDCVFDGSRDFFSENDPVHPINQYGKIKLETEQLIRANSPAALILRVSLVYGWVRRGQSSNTVSEVIRCLKEGQKITLPVSLYNTPVYVNEIARCIQALIPMPRNGILHLAGKDRVSRYELGTRTAQAFGLDPALVLPATTHQGIRPINSCLRVDEFERMFNRPAGSLQAGLAEMAADTPRIAGRPVFDDQSPIQKRSL